MVTFFMEHSVFLIKEVVLEESKQGILLECLQVMAQCV